MPKFTIESTYNLSMFRHRTYEAENVEAAIAAALADENWEGQEADNGSTTPHTVTGIWEGEDSAYSGRALPCPVDPAEMLRDAAPDMLAALKELAPLWPLDLMTPSNKILPYFQTAKMIRDAITKAEGRDDG